MSDLVGLIPAAGKGVRAYPYTATIPKSMLEVDGVPVLQRNVELMRDQLGIRDIYIVVGYQGDVIRNHFGDGQAFGVHISYIANPRVDLELPYSIHLAGSLIERPCCMILADECYVGSNHAELRGRIDGLGLGLCGVMHGEYAKQIRKNYSVVLRDGMIVDLKEKPTKVSGRLMGVGTYLLQPELFALLADAYAAGPESGPRDWTSWLATQAAQGRPIGAFEISGRYVNINSRDDLNYANYLVRNADFGHRTTSLVYVIDEANQEAVTASLARFRQMPEIDEILAVGRKPLPAFADELSSVRTVIADNPDAQIGDVVKLGLARATGDILILCYGDDTFQAHDVAKFLAYLRDADMVVGTRTTRQLIEQGTNMRGIVRAAHVALAKLVQLFWWRFETRLTDVCCVYRAFWRSTYQTIAGNLSARGADVYPEMVIEVMRARRRIVEIPINYYNSNPTYDYVWSKYQNAPMFLRILWMTLLKRCQDWAASWAKR